MMERFQRFPDPQPKRIWHVSRGVKTTSAIRSVFRIPVQAVCRRSSDHHHVADLRTWIATALRIALVEGAQGAPVAFLLASLVAVFAIRFPNLGNPANLRCNQCNRILPPTGEDSPRDDRWTAFPFLAAPASVAKTRAFAPKRVRPFRAPTRTDPYRRAASIANEVVAALKAAPE